MGFLHENYKVQHDLKRAFSPLKVSGAETFSSCRVGGGGGDISGPPDPERVQKRLPSSSRVAFHLHHDLHLCVRTRVNRLGLSSTTTRAKSACLPPSLDICLSVYLLSFAHTTLITTPSTDRGGEEMQGPNEPRNGRLPVL